MKYYIFVYIFIIYRVNFNFSNNYQDLNSWKLIMQRGLIKHLSSVIWKQFPDEGARWKQSPPDRHKRKFTHLPSWHVCAHVIWLLFAQTRTQMKFRISNTFQRTSTLWRARRTHYGNYSTQSRSRSDGGR